MAKDRGQGTVLNSFYSGTGFGSSNHRMYARNRSMRKPRELEENARYHVTARANRKEMILETSEMKEMFLSVLRRAKRKYDFRLENFCIMGNHFHFVIQPGRSESLSAIMRWILSVFAMAFNRIKGYTGHVWGCRFFSKIIACLREFVRIFEYIDDNPVRAGQVEDRLGWRWGGLWHERNGCRDLVAGADAWLRPYLSGREHLLLR